jgi:hypothetical protein
MSDKPVLTHQQIGKIIDKRFKEFKGNLYEFESAVGALSIGQHLGWKVLLLTHDRKTIKKYGDILGIDFRKSMPAEGKLKHKSVAWVACEKISNFWKAVKGEIKGIRTPQISNF